MDTWNYVSTDYIFDFSEPEENCETRNTSCDDGDSRTINDIWDRHCNCIGEPLGKPNCVCDRFDISRYYGRQLK